MADTLPLPAADYWSTRDDDTPLFTADQMRAYALAAVQAEREACAKLCEALGLVPGNPPGLPNSYSCAAAIRARKDSHV